MRFLTLSFLALAIFVGISLADHHHGPNHDKHGPNSSSSEESNESDEAKIKCGVNERRGCNGEDRKCGSEEPTPVKDLDCPKACVCKTGFARKGNACVDVKECEVAKTRRETECTDQNEVYLYCGSACPARCGEKPGEKAPCSLDCVKGCFCKPGYVLNSSNKCVLPQNC